MGFGCTGEYHGGISVIKFRSLSSIIIIIIIIIIIVVIKIIGVINHQMEKFTSSQL